MIPRKLFYAVEAVLYIAYNAGRGPIAGRGIAARQGLPPRYLEQLMQRLVRGGILRSVRGPNGGYLLARERRRISVGDICGCLNGDKDEQHLQGYGGTPLGGRVVAPVWETAKFQTMEYLQQVNLADLCEQAMVKHIRKESEEKLDFAI
ncbi:MAG: Rrf2 family transcriptional regulator [Pseudomonadota bacterium]|nr:Rrf2 family transcriptional regulator [Pseudomonadota bacterium]MDE3037664.1 Rrf2 family transcriptional regulator [Pseudomonadota bacterium]